MMAILRIGLVISAVVALQSNKKGCKRGLAAPVNFQDSKEQQTHNHFSMRLTPRPRPLRLVPG
jgi:hypothetical protein